MQKRTKSKSPVDLQERQIKILNIIGNVSILMMSTFMEAFTNIFTEVAQEMVHTITAPFCETEQETKNNDTKINSLKTEIPKAMIDLIESMKVDMKKQIETKKEVIGKMLADSVFDEGIKIVEKYDFGMPKFTQDVDSLSLIKYIALLKSEDKQFSKMFEELMAWMERIPIKE